MLSGFRRAQPELVELTEEQQARASALADEYDSLVDSGAAEDGDEAVLARLEEIQDALEAIEQGQISWSYGDAGDCRCGRDACL
ncbi:hypothetical protein [Rhizobium grahamii]|uniref:ParB-like partition protein n=1 Tax=Rhizobium grahamii CCGE 502 TaxID=990285 RepID=S3HSP5_9HYPH|nr:hypothetical protein [Rhizobium grahamii]EPE96241.1 parB-like partition protein [Rhizobium grahamii CCGE 502]